MGTSVHSCRTREFLESLFELKSDGRTVGSIRKFDSTDVEEYVNLWILVLGKLCMQLKVCMRVLFLEFIGFALSLYQMRVQQTRRSQKSSIVSYKIAKLLQFYLMAMRRTIGEALLSTTLKEYYVSPLFKRTCIFILLFKDH